MTIKQFIVFSHTSQSFAGLLIRNISTTIRWIGMKYGITFFFVLTE